MSKKPSLSFFCPAYNDEKNLPLLIPKVFAVLKDVSSTFEIVIIDDASPDDTGAVADRLAKEYAPYVTVIHHRENKGYGGALRSGFTHAKKYNYVVYTDGDNQYDISELQLMLPHINEYDAVLGYRTDRAIPWQRKLQSSVYNTVIRSLFHLKSRDVNCAFRVVKRSAYDTLDLHSTSAFFVVEFLLAMHKRGMKIKEVPVTHYARAHGKASGGRLKVIVPTILGMLRYYFHRK